MGKTGLFGNSEMRDSEVLLYVKSSLEGNNGNTEQALQDAKMIDTLLSIKKLHLVTHGALKKTKNGNFRKNQTLLDAYESVIEARAKNEL